MKVIARLFSICGLFILLVLPTNKYSWMQEMDPSIIVEDSSGNRAVFLLSLLIIICLIELLILVKNPGISAKIVSSILMFAAILIWSVRHLIN